MCSRPVRDSAVNVSVFSSNVRFIRCRSGLDINLSRVGITEAVQRRRQLCVNDRKVAHVVVGRMATIARSLSSLTNECRIFMLRGADVVVTKHDIHSHLRHREIPKCRLRALTKVAVTFQRQLGLYLFLLRCNANFNWLHLLSASWLRVFYASTRQNAFVLCTTSGDSNTCIVGTLPKNSELQTDVSENMQA